MANAPIIGGLFRSPAPPQPVQAPEVSSPNNAQTQKQVDDAAEKARQKAGSGSASDILTGGSGLSTPPKVSSNVLLGS